MNRMTSVTGLDGDVTRYTYDAAGRRVRTASGTLTTEYSYDSVGNLIRQETSGASEIAFQYSHNKNGYITGEKRTENGQTTESAYAYDALGQLTAFTQSTGYGERYAYDAAGNMLQKVITGTDGKATALSMQYNAGNQLIRMAAGEDSIAYAYDANGSMIRKTLTSAQYGTLTDTYTYDALDMLTGYAGYDGYTQQFTYDANGMRLTKREKGNASRSTMEELLRGSVAGLPDIVEPADAVEEGYAWATTEYLYDVTQEYYQVIRETRADKSGSTATAYAYGLERVAAYAGDTKTTYVYDGRGSVVQTMTAPIPGATAFFSLPDVSVKVQSFTYTAYGEQMGAVKSSGFTYNAEAFDAATGMLNLRARQYELAVNRFSQKDILRGNIWTPVSLHRYAYCINDPISFVDPSGMNYAEQVAFSDGFIHRKGINGGIGGIGGIVTAAAVAVVYILKNNQTTSPDTVTRPLLPQHPVARLISKTISAERETVQASTQKEFACEPRIYASAKEGHREVSFSEGAGAGMPNPEDPNDFDKRGGLQQIRNNKRANEIAQKLGYENAEDLKRNYVYNNISRYNIVYDKKTGEIFL